MAVFLLQVILTFSVMGRNWILKLSNNTQKPGERKRTNFGIQTLLAMATNLRPRFILPRVLHRNDMKRISFQSIEYN